MDILTYKSTWIHNWPSNIQRVNLIDYAINSVQEFEIRREDETYRSLMNLTPNKVVFYSQFEV